MKQMLSIAALMLATAAVAGAAERQEAFLAGGETPREDQVSIAADSLSHDREKNMFTAKGHVRITRDGITLLSDRAFYYGNEQKAVAEGDVVVEKGGDILKGERVTLDLLNRTGAVSKGSLRVKTNNFQLLGDEIEKLGENTYRVRKGVFTTCDIASPSWKFSAGDLTVNESFASGKNAVFYIADVPVFYLPYVVFPAVRTRQTGFLMPRIGNTSKKGFYLDIPYYIDIAANQDMTVDLDIESKRGAGAMVDYRYLRPNKGGGELRGFLIYDSNRSSFRGEILQKHEEYLSPTLTFKSTVNVASDKDFFRDFGEASGDYNRQSLDSEIFITKNWRYASLTPAIRYVNNLEGTDRKTLQRIPSITLTGVETPLTDNLHLQIDALGINFQREEGVKGARLELYPKLYYYQQLSPALDASLWAGYRERVYAAYDGDPGRGGRAAGNTEAGGSLSTTLQRVFPLGDDGYSAVRHQLIPEISYRFTETRSQESLPLFDYNDRVLGQNLIGWSFSNYLTRKFRSGDSLEYREVLRVRISQDILLNGTRRDLLTLQENTKTLSDLRFEAKVTPLPNLTVSTDTRYDTGYNQLSTTSLLIDASDGAGSLIGVGYRYLHDQLSYIEGRLGLKLVKPLAFQYTGRYSFDKSGFLESYYSMEYRHQCWSVALTYRDRLDEHAFLVTFSLAGIGSIGNIRAL